MLSHPASPPTQANLGKSGKKKSRANLDDRLLVRLALQEHHARSESWLRGRHLGSKP
jgi:hypothetical protein